MAEESEEVTGEGVRRQIVSSAACYAKGNARLACIHVVVRHRFAVHFRHVFFHVMQAPAGQWLTKRKSSWSRACPGPVPGPRDSANTGKEEERKDGREGKGKKEGREGKRQAGLERAGAGLRRRNK